MFAAAALAACTTKMPLRRGAAAIDLEKGSIGFLTLRLDATHNPDYETEAVELDLSEVRDGVTMTRYFPIGDPYLSLNLSSDYFLSFQLPAGDYVLERLLCRDSGLFGGFTAIPLDVPIHLPAARLAYFGHFDLDLGRWSSRLQPFPSVLQTTGDIMAVQLRAPSPFAFEVQDHFDDDVALATKSYGLPASADVLNAAVPGTPAGP